MHLFSEEECLPISALQHFLYCPRRAALVFLEGVWSENIFTAEGTVAHQRAHDKHQSETRGNLRVVRGMELRSHRWGLTGKADIIEFTLSPNNQIETVSVIEYKRGSPKGKRDLPFRVQTCAQVLCLEDMLGRAVNYAFIFYVKTKRRVELGLTSDLRQTTSEAIQDLHSLFQSRLTPAISYQKRKCECCSLMPQCLPKAVRPRATARRYLESLLTAPDESIDSDGL
ncbi:MAG: CRISPR-associated protein Cas4 [Pirellulaceae bacterium]|nr:CRISPR-associated protein Cas4 [Pirellulaceae bacterium]